MKNKKAAMEMSMGTMVTIILLVVVLVLGIFFIQKIFFSGTNAIDAVDSQVQSEINKLFSKDEGQSLVIYPSSREVTIKRGSDPKGFAFSVRNKDGLDSHAFGYMVKSNDVTSCKNTLTKSKADEFVLNGVCSISLGAGQTLDLARVVKFDIPEETSACTIVYTLNVKKDNADYNSADIFVTIK